MQFSIPTEKTYQRLIDRYSIDNAPGFITYDDITKINRKYKRVFNLPEGQKYMSNVLEFKKDYDGFHPTQKPVALFEYLIRTYTNPGELVLDNTAGSGTTAVAAERTGRRWICIERDEEYYVSTCTRVMEEAA